MDHVDYLEAVRRLEAESVPDPDSPLVRRGIEAFTDLLSDFKAPDFGARIPRVYADDVFFNDTLKTVEGVDSLQSYLTDTAEKLDKGKVEFLDHSVSGSDHYFRWRMEIRMKKLGGDDKVSVGMTHIRFDSSGKVALHKDFWDAASNFFEHVPVLGWGIKGIKKMV